MKPESTYVLVTAAYNEAAYIEKTLRAVISQTIRPQKWVVVSDGSTDGTDEIVRRYGKDYSFIELIRRESSESGFASQARALMTGCERVSDVDHDFLGTLDADITFGPDYYEAMLARFREVSRLGIAGGTIYEDTAGTLTRLTCDPNSVPGAIQLFRRETFADTGGFLALPRGGHDAVAETMARMRGWRVRSFPDVEVLHLRPCGASYGNALRIRFNMGIREYAYGSHPLFELAKCVRRVGQTPYVLGSLSRWLGYCWARAHREPRQVPQDTIRFLRNEQMQRLWHVVSPTRT